MNENSINKKTILVCLSASPSCQSLIKTASKYIEKDDNFLAIYVSPNKEATNNSVLQANIDLVKNYNGEVVIVESDDVVSSIVEYAKVSGTTDLFIGYSAPSHTIFTRKQIGEELSNYLSDIDIHIIPSVIASAYPVRLNKQTFAFNVKDILIVLGIMAIATILSIWIDQSRYSNGNIITIYILAVLIASIMTSHQVYGILAAALYILLFNFLFIDPRFTLLVYNSEYLVTYLVSLFAAILTGSLASKLKKVATQSAENAYQAKALLDTSNQLERVHEKNEMIKITCTQLSSLLHRVVYYYSLDDGIQNIYACDIEKLPLQKKEEIDEEIILHAASSKHHAGAFTKNYGNCPKRYYSIHNEHNTFGVIGIDMKGKNFSEFEKAILLSILNEFTMALENEMMASEKQEALLQSEKADFRSSLLRSISHDFRTPLTAICGNAENLINNEEGIKKEEKEKIYKDILEDASLLTQQMETILSMTKVEKDEYLNITVESIEDIIQEALKHIDRDDNHKIIIEDIEDSTYVKADMKLIVLVLVNLINNAIKYTPKGSTITLSCINDNDKVWLEVKDDGYGISDKDKEHIFELFYTGDKKIVDSYRSMGIGLHYCYQAMKAHNQEIEIVDNNPHGAIFRFSLEREEVGNE